LGSPARAYVIRPENTEAGSIGTVINTQTGDGVLAVTGTPKRDIDLVVEIVLQSGDCETAKYRYSLDGGATFSDPITTPASGTGAYIGNGITITFTDGSTPSFSVGDKFECEITAPKSLNVLKALTDDLVDVTLRDSVKYLEDFRFIYVCGETDLDDWNTMKKILNEKEAQGYRAEAIMPSVKRGANPVATWKTSVINELNTFYDKRINIVTTPINTLYNENISAGIILTAKTAVIDVNQSAGRVADGMLANVVSIVDEDELKPYKEEFDQARATQVFKYAGYDGYYFTNVYAMSESTSDFKYQRDVRTADEVLTIQREEAIKFLKSDILAVNGVLEAIGSTIESRTKQRMGNKITSLETRVISSLSDLSTTGQIKLRTLIDRRLLINEFDISLGYQAVAE
jgi:hypothetical protein